MPSLEQLDQRISKIEARNKKVEHDKTWETSYTRRGLLILFTYLTIGFYLKAIEVPNPWLNAIVPSLAFWLSTLTLPFLRKLWERYINKH